MEEDKINNNLRSKLPTWSKNPFVLFGGILIIILLGYFLIPYMRTMESPFTQYNPLPIDSTFIKMDTASVPALVDTTTSTPGTNIQPEQPAGIQEEKPSPPDSSDISHLFRLNTDYDKLDPNEQLERTRSEAPDDLFAQLILAELTDSEKETLGKIDLRFGIKPIIHILSTTAVEILAGDRMQYHMEILEAVEQSISIRGIIISDKDQRVVYATNNKYKNLNLTEVFPGRSFSKENLDILEVDGNQLLAFPVHHQYGKIGMIILIIED
jgi:hypothetical protein